MVARDSTWVENILVRFGSILGLPLWVGSISGAIRPPNPDARRQSGQTAFRLSHRPMSARRLAANPKSEIDGRLATELLAGSAPYRSFRPRSEASERRNLLVLGRGGQSPKSTDLSARPFGPSVEMTHTWKLTVLGRRSTSHSKSEIRNPKSIGWAEFLIPNSEFRIQVGPQAGRYATFASLYTGRNLGRDFSVD